MNEPVTDEVRRLRADLAEIETAHRISFHNEQVLRETAPRADVILADVHRALRIACAEIGDNSWEDDLHPADVIDKYLTRPAEHEIERLSEEVQQLRAKLVDVVKWAEQLELDPGTECPLHDEYSDKAPCPPPPYCMWRWIIEMNFRVTCRPDLPWSLEHPERRP